MILGRPEPCGSPARPDFCLDCVCLGLGFILFSSDFVFFVGNFSCFCLFLGRFPAIFPARPLRFPAISPALALRSPADPYFRTNFWTYFLPRKSETRGKKRTRSGQKRTKSSSFNAWEARKCHRADALNVYGVLVYLDIRFTRGGISKD